MQFRGWVYLEVAVSCCDVSCHEAICRNGVTVQVPFKAVQCGCFASIVDPDKQQGELPLLAAVRGTAAPKTAPYQAAHAAAAVLDLTNSPQT